MTAAGTSHAEPTQRGCQPAWESIRIALVRLPKVQLHDRNTCLVRNHHQMENGVSCREGMEGRRPNATLGTGRRGVALPTRYRSSAPGMLARVSGCFWSDQLPQRWALRTEPQGGDALPPAMPCTKGGYSCARLRAATAHLTRYGKLHIKVNHHPYIIYTIPPMPLVRASTGASPAKGTQDKPGHHRRTLRCAKTGGRFH